MVPASVVERILGCHQLKTWSSSDEKRAALRVPIRRRAIAFPVLDGYLRDAEVIRLKDISYTGIGMLVPNVVEITPWFVVRFDQPDKNKTTKPAIHLLCKVSRIREESGLFSLVGAAFTHLMTSKTPVRGGESLAMFQWIDVLSGTPADPDGPAKPVAQPKKPTAIPVPIPADSNSIPAPLIPPTLDDSPPQAASVAVTPFMP